jgi:predicted AlkP superfamily phosphohydrolase/phosphomutase
MIGLDAADPVLVDQWLGEGLLPNLAQLRARGTEMRLETSARHLAGSPWPTFFSGQYPTSHGLYADFQWRPGRMEFAAPTQDWLNLEVFWRRFEGDVPVVIYDVPFITEAQPLPGVEIAGWATHDKLMPASAYPDGLLAEVRTRLGSWPVSYEAYGPAPVQELLELRTEMIENTRRSTDLALWLLERDWRFALICFSALHRGGHRLYDRSSIKGELTEAEGSAFDRALQDLYVETDSAVGRLVAAHPHADLIVFSLHGMMANIARVDLLDEMLARVLAGGELAERPRGLVRRLGEALPFPLRRAITKRIPRGMQNRMMTAWTTGGIDWTRTPAFCCRGDLQGYVRLNLKGREAKGSVAPGAEAEALTARISDGLMTFRDEDTGEALIDEVVAVDEIMPAGPCRDLLPDLLVMWRTTPQAGLRRVISPQFGRIARAAPGDGQGPNGRSGNHRPEGILFAVGKGIEAGHRSQNRPNTVDLAPTVVRRLGVQCRLPLAGTPIPELTRTA